MQTSFAIQDLRREIELRTNTELCRQRMERSHETVPPGFNWDLYGIEKWVRRTTESHVRRATVSFASRRIWPILVAALVGLSVWGTLLEQPERGWLALVAVPPAAWIAWDSHRLRIRDYHTSLAFGPLTLFLLGMLAWIVVLPWYLTVRDLIRAGHVARRSPRPLEDGTSAA